MLGIHDLSKSAPGAASRGRASTRTVLALTTAAAAFFFVVAGAAQAKDCVGGYHMIKDEIPIACAAGFDASAFAPTVPVASEPLHTGSINGLGTGGGNADEIPMQMRATSPTGAKCVGGFAYRPTANESYITMPMPCH